MGSQKKKEVSETYQMSQSEKAAEKSTAEQLAELESQRKELREKVKLEKAAAIQSRKDAKLQRNESVSRDKETVEKIQEAIYDYNRLGKQEKAKSNIFTKITRLIAASGAKLQSEME